MALLAKVMEISSLSDEDRFYIMTNFEISVYPKYQCDSCMRTTVPAMRIAKGCEGFKSKNGYALDLGSEPKFKATKCLGNFWNPGITGLIRAFRLFQKGVLPFEGPLMDQPAMILDAFNLLEMLESFWRQKESVESEKSTRGQRGR
jgi:hypothetical protein